ARRARPPPPRRGAHALGAAARARGRNRRPHRRTCRRDPARRAPSRRRSRAARNRRSRSPGPVRRRRLPRPRGRRAPVAPARDLRARARRARPPARTRPRPLDGSRPWRRDDRAHRRRRPGRRRPAASPRSMGDRGGHGASCSCTGGTLSGGVMVLRGIEQRLERVFEGVFGRAFRTNVQPVELARKLAKEMDEHRSTSVTRVYVPNEYTIYLSPGDREQFEGYENSLVSELEEYLSEHAARENYALLTAPRIVFETDEDLGVGEFGIATRMAQYGRSGDEEAPEVPAPGATMVYKPRTQPTEAASLVELGVERETAVLRWNGQRRALEKRRSVLGRSRDADVQVEDPNG